MQMNPYESPACIPEEFESAAGIQAPVVEGKCLVVSSGTVLPPRCVKTGRPVAENALRRQELVWCSPWVGLLFLINVLVLLLGYFIFRKKCRLTFGLDPQVKRRYRNRLLLKWAFVLGLGAAIPLAAASEVEWLIVGVVLLFIIALVAVFVGNEPLRVVKHRQGRFWIKGCSPEFLASLPPA